ncbi:MAG: zinc transporter ZupT [Paludibacter sp.]|jgi:ZIP family zinc transporter|nr:zinc transporter ZupT [Paludibacter sp.]
MSTDNLLFAFGLTLFAGLATGVGSFIGLLHKKFNPKFLAASLGFSAGVMIYVSLVEIFAKAKDSLSMEYGDKPGYWMTVGGFFAGILLIGIIDKLIPSGENPHEINKTKDYDDKQGKTKLMRLGLFSALAIGIHNFPEGLATFLAAMENPTLGISIAVAIAIHNVPEGLAISVPIYYATKSKKKAFFLSFLSGLAEPIGALVGYFLLMHFLGGAAFGFVFAAVAGIMVYISLDELLPTAEEYGEHHVAIYGLIAGMAVMSVSLVMMA